MELGRLLKVGCFIQVLYAGMEPEKETGPGVQGRLRGIVHVLGSEVDGERQTEVRDYRNTITTITIMTISHKKLPVID